MKIIKHGKYGEGGWTKEITCFHCGAVFEIDENDLVGYADAYYYGATKICTSCPECNTETNVDTPCAVGIDITYNNINSHPRLIYG